MQKTKVHIIPHSHWDKEWYFTSSRSKIYLIKHIKEVLDVLENKEDFGFFLMDAQSSLIEDYLKYCPSDEERLKKLISEKRFLTGPWNTQTDQLVISQESVVRNLYYGIDYADKMGHSMPIGYPLIYSVRVEICRRYTDILILISFFSGEALQTAV